MDINYTDMLSRKLDNFIEKHYANNKSAPVNQIFKFDLHNL